MKESPKAVVLEALAEVANTLAEDKPVTPLVRIRLLATLEYARRKTGEIKELTRIRKPKSQDPVKP